jgi:hypothetical protein
LDDYSGGYQLTDLTKAEMLAYIPPLQSAIRTGSDGGRVTFEVPETNIGEFAKLIAMRGERLLLTVEVIPDGAKQNQKSKF